MWATGDFDGDNLCTGDDVQAILATGLFGQGPYAGTSPLGAVDPLYMRTPSSSGPAGTLPGSGSMRAVPEPATHLVLASGALGLLCWVLRRHRQAAGRGTSG